MAAFANPLGWAWAGECTPSLSRHDSKELRAIQFRVSRDDDGLVGLAKPGVKKSDDIARAAHEKIASDLAYHLGLPVPPVILWDRGEDCESERYVSVSAWAFSPALSWQEAQDQLTDALKSQAAPIVSAMLAFETWISAEDRKSDHLLVNLTEPDSRLQLAFIDYAYCMSKVWNSPDVPVRAVPSYVPVKQDDAATSETAGKICRFDEDTLRQIVNRIPESYLSEAKRQTIISNLLSRSRKIDSIFSIQSKEHAL